MLKKIVAGISFLCVLIVLGLSLFLLDSTRVYIQVLLAAPALISVYVSQNWHVLAVHYGLLVPFCIGCAVAFYQHRVKPVFWGLFVSLIAVYLTAYAVLLLFLAGWYR